MSYKSNNTTISSNLQPLLGSQQSLAFSQCINYISIPQQIIFLCSVITK